MSAPVDVTHFHDLDRHALAAAAAHFDALSQALKKLADQRDQDALRRRSRRKRIAELPGKVYQLVESMRPQMGSLEAAIDEAAALEDLTAEAVTLLYRKEHRRRQRATKARRDASMVRDYRNGRGTCLEIAQRHGLSESYVARIVRDAIRRP